MNPPQLRETTIAPDTRRLIQLVMEDEPDNSDQEVWEIMDMLLSKKRARDRKDWIETEGNIKEIE